MFKFKTRYEFSHAQRHNTHHDITHLISFKNVWLACFIRLNMANLPPCYRLKSTLKRTIWSTSTTFLLRICFRHLIKWYIFVWSSHFWCCCYNTMKYLDKAWLKLVNFAKNMFSSIWNFVLYIINIKNTK